VPLPTEHPSGYNAGRITSISFEGRKMKCVQHFILRGVPEDETLFGILAYIFPVI
jgi:hypothetical protein